MRVKTCRHGAAIPCKRYMIEADQLYRDFSISHAACQRLNQLNAQQTLTSSLFIQFRQNEPALHDQKGPKMTKEKQNQFLNSLFNLPNDSNNDDDSQKDRKEAEHTQITPSSWNDTEISEEGTKTRDEDEYVMEDVSKMNDQAQEDVQEIAEQSQVKDVNLEEADGSSTQAHQASLSPDELVRRQKEYDKNLLSNISKAVRKKMFMTFRTHVVKKCKQKEISIEEFERYCDIKKFKSIHGLVSLFGNPKNQSESRIQEIFKPLFQKILRRAYLRTAMMEGKMTDLRAYCLFKNRYLLNFDQFHME